MEIEKIETRERESALAQLILIGLAIIVIILSVRIILEILFGGETKVIGTLIGIALLVLAMILGVLKKGFIAEEIVTAIEKK